MTRTLLIFGLLLTSSPLTAQQGVEYEISFPNLVHHEAEISVTFNDVTQKPLEIRMSRSSPGRYALHEFAKNVYAVTAVDGAGRPLAITRPNPHQWDVQGHDGTVTFRYTLFGDRADGTYTGIDNTHAHLNMPATFAWARGLEDQPISITFRRPRENWKIATQLVPTSHPERFTAPDLSYFLDSPTEISDFDLRSWEIVSNGQRQTIRLAVHHDESSDHVDRYAEMTRRVVDEQIAVFGTPPTFDHGTYTFIACYTPWVAGDGMEHRNSTILTSTRPLSTGALQNLGTVSHEFFHVWNVERLRPRSLEPFDLEEANMSGELWFAEGFTSYYTNYILRRAGLLNDDEYAASLTGMLNTVINSPGRRFFSPVEMSKQAPFVDAAASIDPQNRANTFISYYTWGAAIGLGLDLTLREQFSLTLDDYMRAAWERFGREERPYSPADLRILLGEVTRDQDFADRFFDRYVEGRDVVDYESLLGRAGYLLRRAEPGRSWLGAPTLVFVEGGAQLTGPTLIGTPIHGAGIGAGDRIITINGVDLVSENVLTSLLEAHAPGTAVELTFLQRGELRSANVVLGESPRLEVVTYESAGRPVTLDMQRFRSAWLQSGTRR
ncbi:MAG: M61 family metallopeptidase [Gemmatimonadetes bacterium]|nr:M61 family metallopeptidase [Gemmatimonadota bacterium]